MKALILNSGMGQRMGELTKENPKCLTIIGSEETILSRQLKLLYQCGISEVIMTTGYYDNILIDYCKSLGYNMHFNFVRNPIYNKTNYIYSIYNARQYLNDDIILMHGDLVFELCVLHDIINFKDSCMTVSTTIPLPQKDFKAVILNNRIYKIGIEFFDHALVAQPLYKINISDWKVWLNSIIAYCLNGQVSCYAENAFNEVSDNCSIYPLDIKNRLCKEIDTPTDLENVNNILKLILREGN